MKIVKRIINHKYFSFSPDILRPETTVPFDIFIKRSDEFVIIIEAGTLLTQFLYEKVLLNKTIYALLHDSEKIKSYGELHIETHETKEKILNHALMLKDHIQSISDFEERLKNVYMASTGLMGIIFEENKDTLPLNALYAVLIEIVNTVQSVECTMPKLLNIMTDHYTTENHSVNVALLAAMMAKTTELQSTDIMDVTFAALLHDIGKIVINQDILLKPDALSDEEYQTVMSHSQDGYQILKKNGISSEKILQGVLCHHEKIDGTGYPQQLRGKTVPKFARIIGICDVFDALTTHRTYRRSYTSFEALQVMKQEMTGQFDERYVNAFIKLLH